MVNFGRRLKSDIARYVYDDPDPKKARFLGRFKNGILDETPEVKGDPWNRCVALSPNGKNDYPPLGRITRPPDEIRSNGKLIGYAFRYK